MDMKAKVIVTRPAREAERWVKELSARGLHAQALPLIEIAPPLDLAALRQARERLADNAHAYAAVMWVSPNAVSGFWGDGASDRLLEIRRIAAGTRAWSPGPGTTQALQRAGWPVSGIDAPAPDAPQFDSESLWEQVKPQLLPGRRILIVRGANAQGQVAGRDWLAKQLRAAGLAVEEVAAYRRIRPSLDAGGLLLARAGARGDGVWLFSSSEAVANLVELLPECDWSGGRAIATHPRIAEAARQAGFGYVIETHPTLQAVAASIESIA